MAQTTILHPDPATSDQLKPELTLPFVDEDPAGKLSAFSHLLDTLPRQPILNHSWPAYATACRAWFSMLYTPQAFVLKYEIRNDFFRSVPRGINEPVHLDNCVECFLQFGDDASYYNIEFNCLGSGKMAYGPNNRNRQFLSPASVSRIGTWVRSAQTGDRFDWEMVLMIPADTFEFHQVVLNSDLKCRGNFYKCGDLLPQPHFLTWSQVGGEQPNFHRPEAFRPIHLAVLAANNIL